MKTLKMISGILRLYTTRHNHDATNERFFIIEKVHPSHLFIFHCNIFRKIKSVVLNKGPNMLKYERIGRRKDEEYDVGLPIVVRLEEYDDISYELHPII